MRAMILIIGAIVFALVISSFIGIMTDINTNYDVDIDTSSLNRLQTGQAWYNLSVQSGKSVDKDTGFLSQEGVTQTGFLTRAFNSVKLLFRSLTIIPEQLGIASKILMLPDWLNISIMAIVILTLTIGIISLLMGIIRGGGQI